MCLPPFTAGVGTKHHLATHLNVPVSNLTLVEVLHGKEQLVEEKLDSGFRQAATGYQPVEEFPATCCFHDDEHFLWGLYGVEELDDAWLV